MYRHTQTGRQTDRQLERWKSTQTDRWTKKLCAQTQTGRQTARHRERWESIQTDRWTKGPIYRHTLTG